MAAQAQHSATDLTAYPSSLQAIIFDVDGTLADTELCGHFVAYNQVFEALKLPWRWGEEQYRKMLEITGGAERLRYYLNTVQAGYSVPDNDRNSFALRLHQLKNDCYRQLVINNAVPLRPGVRRLIAEARASGLRLAIATASHPDNVQTLLTHALGDDAAGWFEVIAGGSDVKAKKPAPDIYQHVLAKLELPASNAIVIEDSAQGLQAALQTGLTTLVTTNHFTEQQDFTGAAAVVDNLGEPDQPCHFSRGDKAITQHPLITVNTLRELLASNGATAIKSGVH